MVASLLSKAQTYDHALQERKEFPPLLKGKIVALFFFEASTRTRLSFELAAKHLGATVIDVAPNISSLKKGESLNDTVETLKAMKTDFIVMRHHQAGAPHILAREGFEGIINAGDGMHAHPTQALLDAVTLRRHYGSLSEKKIAICGDIKHSRVARSDIKLLIHLGCSIRLIAPYSLMDQNLIIGNVTFSCDMQQGLKDIDALIMLRIQNERMTSSLIPSQEEYFRFYGLNEEKLSHIGKDVLILHPGPVNKFVEIDPKIINHKNCLISEQIRTGVATRMAVFDAMRGNGS